MSHNLIKGMVGWTGMWVLLYWWLGQGSWVPSNVFVNTNWTFNQFMVLVYVSPYLLIGFVRVLIWMLT